MSSTSPAGSGQVGLRDISQHPNTLDPVKLVALLEREHAARLRAEQALESKKLALTEANAELESLVGGSFQLLTQLLAMARPELFQKAAKVQVWAKRISKQVKIEKPWELDLASLLYPIGIIGLPDWLVRKHCLGHKLTTTEQAMLDESALAAFQLVNKIPRMRSVARALLYCRRGYDGTGYPVDGLKGEQIPQTARILRILIDFVDQATGDDRNRVDAFKYLVAQREKYDDKLLKAIGAVMVETRRSERQEFEIVPRSLGSLKPGMVIGHDISDNEGRLLLAAGVELTQIALKRLKTLQETGRFAGMVSIQVEKKKEKPDNPPPPTGPKGGETAAAA